MTPATRRAVWALGACQCVFWGVLYYGFSVLLVPLETELGLSRAAVAGAFSLGLLVAALGAPQVGRWVDRDHGARVFRTGAVIAVVGLLMGARVETAAGLYAVWLVLGAAMATLLYEPAFGLVIRAFPHDQDRLHALAAVTVFGGLASTVCLPLLSLAVSRWGWRLAEVLAAVVIAMAAVAMELGVLPVLRPASAASSAGEPLASRQPPPRGLPRGFAVLGALFVTTTLSTMGLTTLLVPLLIERGRPPTAAATALAMLGIMQLPGRVWVLRGGGSSMRRLVVAPLVLQATGLGLVAATSSLALAALGVALFGIGAGLHTLGRPWLVQRLYGRDHAGYWNGQVARLQGLARACGPLAAALLAGVGGTVAVFAGLSLALALWVPIAWRLASEPEAQMRDQGGPPRVSAIVDQR